jgi:hypothetical protein
VPKVVHFPSTERRQPPTFMNGETDLEAIRVHVNGLPIETLPTAIIEAMACACRARGAAVAASNFYIVACASIRLADAGYLPGL